MEKESCLRIIFHPHFSSSVFVSHTCLGSELAKGTARPINFKGEHSNSWSINSRVNTCGEMYTETQTLGKCDGDESAKENDCSVHYLEASTIELSKCNQYHQELKLQEELASAIWPKAQLPRGCQDTD